MAEERKDADGVCKEKRSAKDPLERTGVFTSGIVSTKEGRKIALFFTGRKHAGENLETVLRRRASDLPSVVQMCDALSRNLPKELKVILANCIAHYLESDVIWREPLDQGWGGGFLPRAAEIAPDNGNRIGPQ
jgi:hypothetical protein